MEIKIEIKKWSPKPKRTFTPFYEDIDEILNMLVSGGLIKLQEPKDMNFPKSTPTGLKVEHFYNYHQCSG